MLDLKSTTIMAIRSLKINRMRSMLTSLGIIIGVSAVIIMLAVGTGASKRIAKEKEETKETIHYNFNYEANLTEEDLVSLQSAIEFSLEAGKQCL